MCFLEYFEALIGCALIHPGSKYYHSSIKPPQTATSERSLESQPSFVTPTPHEINESRLSSEYPARETSEQEIVAADEEKHSSRVKSFSENAKDQDGDRSDEQWSLKIDDFFNGVFIPASSTLLDIQEEVRYDQEKTWQGPLIDNIDRSTILT
ncbi:unnamed protein product [Didymodactylos carnosus]|uniref:Uncharacterized protein n=1 Tax=Didymodactylos carnosus TaxID=1234261 RepID=A0A816AXE2_9BILA|nr:unnamed protein product [Didymodactylos carnosus]CAF1602051.1 unnamed protein product [Didymodactylos carnosus]CAF4213471.1 unnamed protein product [Didymodactylos carnosus]CAF4479800.1 unnamed protein product [Didymodactylos carnosus]